MPQIFGDKFQMFITCDEEGNVTSAEYGQMIVRMEEADFFFLYPSAKGNEIMENIENYKVQIDGFKPSLVLKEAPIEEPTPEPTPETEPEPETQPEPTPEQEPTTETEPTEPTS